MIIEIPDDNSIVKWKKNDKDEWKYAEIADLIKAYEVKSQGEWIDYDNTFYKCPDCGYLLEKCCPKCQTKVILPRGDVE